MIESLQRHWAHLHGRRYGSFIWTASGQRFYPLDPRPEDFKIEDVARGLANQIRFAGQVGLDSGYMSYSVAEHSVIVSQYVEKIALSLYKPFAVVDAWAMEGLLHDATEAYIGDVARPLKYTRMMAGYRKCEARVEREMRKAFDLHPTAESRLAVKQIDDRILVDEINAFMSVPEEDSRYVERFGEPLGCAIAGLPPTQAENVFLQRYAEIVERMHGKAG